MKDNLKNYTEYEKSQVKKYEESVHKETNERLSLKPEAKPLKGEKKPPARPTDIYKGKGRIKTFMSGFVEAAIVAGLVILQFVFIYVLSYRFMHSAYVYAIIEIISFLIIVSLVNGSKSPSYKMAWIAIIALLPLTGHIIYILWGRHGVNKSLDDKVLYFIRRGNNYNKKDDKVLEAVEHRFPAKSRMVKYLQNFDMTVSANNKVTYYDMADKAFEAFFEDVRNAKKYILINFFIVGEGALWDKLHELLLEKVKEGVKIKFLYDDFGSLWRVPKNFKQMLEAEGIEVAVFNPINRYISRLYMNYRSHQKILVIDGEIGYTGGFNLADEYVNLVNRFGTWKDTGIRIEGEGAWGLTVAFLQMWEVSKDKECIDYNAFKTPRKFEKNDTFCQIITDGPANNPRNPIESMYSQIINSAKKYVYITTPYLLIDDDMMKALVVAAEGGIDVRIVTPRIPDKKAVKLLTEYNYGPLLRLGVKIYEYNPGFIHAKCIITESCGIVGTINMDYRSFYLHYECGAFIIDPKVMLTIKEDILTTLGNCKQITYEEWQKRPLKNKLIQPILMLFSPLM